METKGIKRLTGEELLLMRVLGIGSPQSIERELQQRALAGPPASAPKRRTARPRLTLMAAA
ncbi:MAG: hypothetical protein ABFD92_19475 [Planctomycetaceae bacterium]|nr:hypothetical protein [Planctomycetaceae bacterium]